MKNSITYAILLSIGALCGCSGGGGSSPVAPTIVSVSSGGSASGSATPAPSSGSAAATPAPTSTTSSSGTTQAATATIKLQIPINGTGNGGSVQSNLRRAQFVSPGTMGIQVAVTNYVGGASVFSQAYDVSGGSNCSTANNLRTCTITMPLSTGDYDVTLTTWNAAPVSGTIPGTASQLGTATTTNQTITSGQTTAIAFNLEGVVSTVSVVNSSNIALTATSLPADGSTHTLALGIQAYDASGNQITGPVQYSTPISVSAGETGGSGHTTLVINGSNKGSSSTLSYPTDTLVVSYDGGGASGYGVTLTAGSASAKISPMYLSVASAAITTLTATTATVASEANASGVSYNVLASTGSCAGVKLGTVTAVGPASGQTLSIPTTVSGGTSESCVLTVSDNYGSSLPLVLHFTSAGPITTGSVTFSPSGTDSGSCPTGLTITEAGDTGSFTVTDPGGTGLGVSSASTSIATISLVGSTATVTAVASGATSFGITDAQGNSFSCPINITATEVQVQGHHR